MLDYVLSDGHRDLLLNVTNMYRDLMANKEITTENIKLAHLLGWCIEIVSLLTIEILLANSNKKFHESELVEDSPYCDRENKI